ncbi:hypothetical protein [Echinicola strongylocentroti]|nr:hypothetical protein [Echinicola strongylocentroti]
MKKKLLLLLLILPLSITLLHAQNLPEAALNIHLGSQNFTKNNMMPNQIVASDEKGIYITKIKLSDELRGKSEFPIIEFYNHQMELMAYHQLHAKNHDTPPRFEQITQVGDRLYCFYSTYDKGQNQKKLWADEIEKSTLSLRQSPFCLQSFSPQKKAKFKIAKFHLKLSDDNNTILATFKQPGAKNDTDTFNFKVVDQEMKEIWSSQLKAPYNNSQYVTTNIHLSISGDLYLLNKAAPSEKALAKFWEPNYHYSIIAITDQGKTQTTIQPQVQGKHFTKMQISTNHNNQLVCAGFYTDQLQNTTSGSYFLTLKGQKITQKSFQAFEPKSDEGQAKGSKVENQKYLYTYLLNDIEFRGDGSAVLIAEQTSQSPGASFTSHNHLPMANSIFNTIAVVSIAPEGEIMWTKKIHKNQLSPEGYSFFSSYATAVLHDKIYLVFNDHPENLSTEESDPVRFNPKAAKKELMIAMVELDWNGHIKKEALSFSRDLHLLTKPLACKQVSSHQMVVLGQYNNAYRMARLDFEKTFSYQ